jgi:hypothetical protein
MKRIFLMSLFLFVFYAIDTHAANWYVRADGGSGSGTNWNTAWSGLGAINWNTVSCGDTIWIAGGTYSNDMTPAKSCTSGSPLYVRRARSDASACTSAAGWSSSFDSTVIQVQSGIRFSGTVDYMTISGRTTASGGGYGWKIYYQNVTTATAGIDFYTGSNTRYLTVEYTEIAGPSNANWTVNAYGVNDAPYKGSNSNHTFSHMSIHGWNTGIFVNYAGNHTFEYIDMYNIYGNSTVHPNLFYIINSNNGIIRYSKFHDSAASGTGIAFSDGGPFENWQIYGNLFYDMTDSSGTAIAVQRATITGLKIFNNTFSNNVFNFRLSGAMCGTGCETKNNIVHGAGGSVACGSTSNGLETSNSRIFVNSASKDFHIVSTTGAGYPRNAGTDLSYYFMTDMDGTTFTTWDIGAFAYSTTYDRIRPAAPSNLSIH